MNFAANSKNLIQQDDKHQPSRLALLTLTQKHSPHPNLFSATRIESAKPLMRNQSAQDVQDFATDSLHETDNHPLVARLRNQSHVMDCNSQTFSSQCNWRNAPIRSSNSAHLSNLS